eukprot:COSAG05_NODE_1221_length_5476_cov_72.306305_2_plen_111_part_00
MPIAYPSTQLYCIPYMGIAHRDSVCVAIVYMHVAIVYMTMHTVACRRKQVELSALRADYEKEAQATLAALREEGLDAERSAVQVRHTCTQVSPVGIWPSGPASQQFRHWL